MTIIWRQPAWLGLLIVLAEGASACTSAVKPVPQNVDVFLGATYQGQLGLRIDDTQVYVLDTYRCYDVSSALLDPRLILLFDNFSNAKSTTDPTYIGATVVKQFKKTSSESEGAATPIDAAFYRNEDKADTPSDWAHAVPDAKSQLVRGKTVDASSVEILDSLYDPRESAQFSDFASLNSFIATAPQSSSDKANDQLVLGWHGIIVAPTPKEKKVKVFENTETGLKYWSVPNVSEQANKYVVKYYLIKYQSSRHPKGEPFFTIGGGADCVYIKLVPPGVDNPAVNIKLDGQDFMTLKLNRNAVCAAGLSVADAKSSPAFYRPQLILNDSPVDSGPSVGWTAKWRQTIAQKCGHIATESQARAPS